MDSGEYGFGIMMTPLAPGIDCPRSATFLDSIFHDDYGMPLTLPGTMCVFERSTGDPAWRHYEAFAQTPGGPAIPTEGRPATELVFRYASTVGNYDYLVDYVFMQDGTIKVAVGSTGYVDTWAAFASLLFFNPETRTNPYLPPPPPSQCSMDATKAPRRGPCPTTVPSKRPSTVR
jgi:Cu2+-containing amine oxidase